MKKRTFQLPIAPAVFPGFKRGRQLPSSLLTGFLSISAYGERVQGLLGCNRGDRLNCLGRDNI
ncbi:hypothetical protein [Laspinema palackyanum]|uniref:hypothetical protein n=1 Tax=Laspinema palackyanum TaxID=3231601 RepID=UPI00345E04CB|nr:hypothetical protein [Laspinema sp. D2c]